jgi:hypothetical protein
MTPPTNNPVAPSDDVFWLPMDDCPRAVKVQLLGPGGVAIYGTFDGKDKQWLGWQRIPRRRKKES